ncbi:MAG: isoprenyl transferase [Chloroflexi bacterium]|nr:isoprenyl transferase [Chloroflexota bacterium]OQA95782.1 MAG: Isoprenyl transferase [Chloroflexi bacterium ADurb.Bin222]HOC20383.1 isoprenyl transferase [Anaerolineae bacterium]HQJ11573.1 isoprenyl transferase [Anaerolineae bacterium]HQM13849.1 isoprenyl transferase [Anaerolineae bacterium]
MSDHGEDQQKYPPLPILPTHVGIIMDGNGRWAQARGLPRLAGHRAGVENLRRVLRAAVDFGIPILTLYAFSTENWKRPEAEVRGLLHLLREGLTKEVGELHKNGVQLRHLGDLSALPGDLQHRVQDALELTRHNTALIANIAFNYGGRMELVEAMRAIAREGLRPEEITEEVISNHLFTAGLPDPDLIIRTSGEFRISNFLIWQGAYAEYYIPSVYWPDFDKDEFYKALQSFSQRERRYGALSEA